MIEGAGESSPDARPELRFDGRVAVVTGAGSGLGRAHARLLASRGALVVVNDLPTGEGQGGAARVVAEITSAGGSAVACEVDIAEAAGAAHLVATAMEAGGRLDALVNNAGLLRSVPFEEMTTEVFDLVVGVNLRATFLVTRAAWPIMLAQGSGRVLSTTSNSGLLGTAGSTAYAAAKAGIWGLTRSLALEGRSAGIGVNAIAPIAFTPMSMTSRIAPPSWQSGEGDEWARRLDPAVVAPAAAWLVHPDCPENGQVWSVAGGRVAQYFMGLSRGYVAYELSPEIVRDRRDELFVDDFEVLPRAADEGRNLRRRLLSS